MSPSRRGPDRCLHAAMWLAALLALAGAPLRAALPVDDPAGGRRVCLLDTDWRTTLASPDASADATYAAPGFDDRAWRTVEVPHNWDDYYGYRQMRHGNLHGTAWYRRHFNVPAGARGRRVFLFFEGAGSFATVWVNGRLVGRHAGGLTTFTLDITAAARFGADNVVAVRTDHPAGIRDLPSVCGGCELAAGFSEGSEPFGLSRPVHLVITAPVRIEPFGIHVWNDRTVTARAATANVRTEVKNYGDTPAAFTVATFLLDRRGTVVAAHHAALTLAPGATATSAATLSLAPAHLWSLADPYLYTVRVELRRGAAVIDRAATPFGFRWIEWPRPGTAGPGVFLLNGHPVFINGIAGYEHLLGGSHAFTAAQVRARVRQVEAAGFNAFRDAHHPHNLRYQEYWDRDGLLWWPEFSAHIWFDTPAFRANFLTDLREWVKERRNSPSLVLWGLQNESQLPAAFARECCAVIREMDPTATTQRLITTCNGGDGTDWDVPQNWSGTYGGDPAAYARDLLRERLSGEYGAWRSLGLHAEPGAASPGCTEEQMAGLLETKIRLAESVRSEVCGQFLWLLATHDNPGRDFGPRGEQLADGWRMLDRIGPANNKGLLTLWGEPVDAYYLYRANYAPAATQPMVYIVSHTWPDRWTAPGRKSAITVYSNCDEVELFNDYRHDSLGVRHRDGIGTHFEWDNVPVRYNLLYAEARRGGKVVATDWIELHHLPAAPHLAGLNPHPANLTAPAPGWNYLYRVNCGGPACTDVNGDRWSADRTLRPGDTWGSVSWAAAFPGLPPDLGSTGRITDPIIGARDAPLFQTFRYGRQRLRYEFAVPDGNYRIELYFTEPWYGTGGGLDCTGWRLFDVAVNGATVIRNLDVWRESGGRAHALKRVVTARITGGRLVISFPRVESYQAVISAIAIATDDPRARAPAPPRPLIADLQPAPGAGEGFSVQSWLDTGDRVYSDQTTTLAALPETLRDAHWLRLPATARTFSGERLATFRLTAESDVYVAYDAAAKSRPAWLTSWTPTGDTLETAGDGGATFALFRRHFLSGEVVTLGPNASGGTANPAMYLTLVVPTLPARPAQVIHDLAVTGTPDAAHWHALGHLARGNQLNRIDGPAITVLPSSLTDCDWLRIPAEDRDRPIRATFTVSDPAEVYVALDERIATPPPWLEDWIPTKLHLTAGSLHFALWEKRFAPGATVTLGPNGRAARGASAAMFAVLAQQVRPATLYPAALAAPVPGEPGAIEWTIRVGVGDRYGLDIAYRLAGRESAHVRYELLTADNRVICHRDLEFPPTEGQTHFSVFRLRTCASINAGTYRVRLTKTPATPLVLSSLEVE